jgi:exonuclease III
MTGPIASLLSSVVYWFIMVNVINSYKMLSWNVRGLNNPTRQEDIKQVIHIFKSDIVCTQETKMSFIDPAIVQNSLGFQFDANFVYLPADGTRGGILIAARDSSVQLLNPATSNHMISVHVKDNRHDLSWMLIGVYGPQVDLEKKCSFMN